MSVKRATIWQKTIAPDRPFLQLENCPRVYSSKSSNLFLSGCFTLRSRRFAGPDFLHFVSSSSIFSRGFFHAAILGVLYWSVPGIVDA